MVPLTENQDEAEGEEEDEGTTFCFTQQSHNAAHTHHKTLPVVCCVSDSEKEPDYRDVSIRTDVKVKELYDVEERLGTYVR